jgi:RHS repeat-associated protein
MIIFSVINGTLFLSKSIIWNFTQNEKADQVKDAAERLIPQGGTASMSNLNLPNTLHEIMLPDSSHQMILSDEISSYPGAVILDTMELRSPFEQIALLNDSGEYTIYSLYRLSGVDPSLPPTMPSGDPFLIPLDKAEDPPYPDLVYYIHDHLGNARVLYHVVLDCSEGSDPLEYYADHLVDYRPFGSILREYLPEVVPEKFLTTHHERDVQTGLDYRGARFFDSDLGRFLSVDPLADAPANIGTSPYGYVWNNPLKFIDPDGRHGESVDDIYIFNKDGTFSGEVIEAPGEDVGMVRDYYGEGEDMTFNFADPENTPGLLVTPDALSQMQIKTADNGEFFIDRVEYQGKFDIQVQLMSADAFGPNPGPLYSLLTESRGFSARLDYSAKGSLLDRTSTLFLTEGADGNYTGHDFRNYGNFLWGATTKTWGVPGFIARMGANADVMWNEGSWDSGDDQRSIQLGREYAKQMGWKRRSF